MSDARINPVDAWRIFSAVRLHFDGNYDAHRYNFRMPNLKPSAFEGRRDRYFFEKAARNYATQDDYVWFCVSNILYGHKWIGEMNQTAYDELKTWHESMAYKFTEELKLILDRFGNFDDMIEANVKLDGTRPPPILVAYSNLEVSIHTITILECLTGFLKKEMVSVSDPMGIWNTHATRIMKYAPFLKAKLDANKYKNIVISLFTK
jgi:hypothetical protein